MEENFFIIYKILFKLETFKKNYEKIDNLNSIRILNKQKNIMPTELKKKNF